MASTRNKNSPGNYQLEEWAINKRFETRMYPYAAQGKSVEQHYAGNGLIGGRIHARDLAHNACDIESFLRGIGSTNLVNPQAPVVPQVRSLDSLNIIHKKPMVVPEQLIVEPNQRPMYLN